MPVSIGPDVAGARSRLGVACKLGTPADVSEARRDLAAAKLADYIKRTVDQAPPLTDEQRERIAALLRPTAIGGAA